MKYAAAIVLAALIPATHAFAYDEKDVIDYRGHIMKSLDAQAAALGMIVSTQIPADNLIAHLDAIALTAQQSLKSFEQKVPGGESKPLVWEQWKDFSERMNTFAAKTAELAQTARTKGQDAVVADMVSALACKSCHDIYRNKK
ncbi:MAG: cytochrome c [Rhodospirillaceae bacterium]|nr:cytochrome c [Rhodospirillaceae bacterium]